jgi:hypothetical protein
MQRRVILTTLAILSMVGCSNTAPLHAESGQVSDASKQFLLTYPNLQNPDGEVVFENEHVILQRLVVPAGEWEGVHSHPGNQLYVHIKGGEWSGRLGGESQYSAIVSEDGDVGWMDAIPLSAGHNSGNTGDTDIDLIYVTLKGDAPIAPDVDHEPQYYPNVPLDLLFENDRMIVQRGQIGPGQWEGVHSHPGNQIFIHIKGGVWSSRMGGKLIRSGIVREDGAAGWMDAIPLSAGHESGNTGDTAIDLVWVTLK